MKKLKHAKPEQAPEVYKHFLKRKDIFPHIRKDYCDRMVNGGHCVYDSGVIITYQQYKKSVKLGDTLIPKGAVMLHQILNTKQFSGKAREIFERFCNEIVKPLSACLVLSVRADNTVARKFYEKYGMEVIGTVNWKIQGKPLPGVIYHLFLGPSIFDHI